MLKIYSTNEFWLILSLFLAMWIIAILLITLLHYKRILDGYAVRHGDKEPLENTVINVKENINIYSWVLLSAVIDKIWSVRNKIIYFNDLHVRQLVANKILK